MPEIVENLVFQHAEKVCSLLHQRQSAVEEPRDLFADHVQLDNQVEANPEAIGVAGESRLLFLEEMLEAEDEGACFALAMFGLYAGDKKRLSDLIDEASPEPQLTDELISVLVWCNPAQLKDIVNALLACEDGMSNALDLKTCAVHYKTLGDNRRWLFAHKNSLVRSIDLCVGADIGGIKISLLLWTLDALYSETKIFGLGKAFAISDKHDIATGPMAGLVLSTELKKNAAIDLSMQLFEVSTRKILVKTLDRTEGRSRDVDRGFGLLGDPGAVSWLIDKTEISELARLAGSARIMITCVDLAMDNLETLDLPEEVEAGPDDNPSNDVVILIEVEDLLWTDTDLVRKWWDSSAKLPPGDGHLIGRENVTA